MRPFYRNSLFAAAAIADLFATGIVLTGCASPGDQPAAQAERMAERAMAASSGDANATRSEEIPLFGASGAYLGDAVTYNSSLKTAREAQEQNTGPVQFVFQAQADAGEIVATIRGAVLDDSGVGLLRAQIEAVFPVWREALRAAEPRAAELAAQLEELRAKLNARTSELVAEWTRTATAAAESARMDLGQLQSMHIVSWNWNQGTGVGRDHKELTDSEAQALAAAALESARVGAAVAGRVEALDKLGFPPPKPDAPKTE